MKMRTLLAIVLMIGLLAAGCGRPGAKFSLSAEIEHSKQSADPLILIIGLKNITTRTQTVIVPTTGLFWGGVSCRDSNGVTHAFIHTNILGWVDPFTVVAPFDLAPGATRQWRHPLSEFVEALVLDTQAPTYRFLDREFHPGGELWCEFRVAQESIYKTVESLSSVRIGYPQPLTANGGEHRR